MTLFTNRSAEVCQKNKERGTVSKVDLEDFSFNLIVSINEITFLSGVVIEKGK